ncbi:MAG TPA: helicase-related protein [Armatimonadota bacterium]|nr:helicase-related protein [Armatimonadota bacterium]
MATTFSAGMTVRVRGLRAQVTDWEPLPSAEGLEHGRLTVRLQEGPRRGSELQILTAAEAVTPDRVEPLSLDRIGRASRFRLLHQAFLMQLSPPDDVLIAPRASAVRYEPYQYVPAYRALRMPRPRLLIADDTGLGKTIEAGIVLRELTARRRAGRVLVICPASIMSQWQDELLRKFGMRFDILDRDGLYETRRKHEAGTNPWSACGRGIASMDFVKRREGAFQELSASRWDVVIVDEAHHLAGGADDKDDVTDRHRLGRWLSEAADALLFLTATPHDGYDERFASLLNLLDPTLAPGGKLEFRRYSRSLVRRLKGHIRDENGQPKFVPRAPVEPVAVELSPEEKALHQRVRNQAKDLDEMAAQVAKRRRAVDAEAIRLVATVLRKRAASSRAALKATLENRIGNLEEAHVKAELRRDHLRALKRGDTVPDEALKDLERDAHQNYLSVVRGYGKDLRRYEDERAAVEDLLDLLLNCWGSPESKMVALTAWLSRVPPPDKVIIFSEYADTVAAIETELEGHAEWAGQSVVLTGTLSREQRTAVIREWAGPGKRFLIATDAASEGLNLHHCCHRVLHFELPWNPNRLEQRNGRVDRYGQTEAPQIGFLYAANTYEGEVLARLLTKIENQVRRLGSVGDVLGPMQVSSIVALLERTPPDELAAIDHADREIDNALNLRATTGLRQHLGDGTVDEAETDAVRDAVARSHPEWLDVTQFVAAAAGAAGGQVQRTSTGLSVTRTPYAWIAGQVEASYAQLLSPSAELPEGEGFDAVLCEEHALVQAAVRWVRGTRYDATDDHRVAYHVVDGLQVPELVCTFVVRLRDGTGREVEKIEAVRVTPDGVASRDASADADLLWGDSGGNADPEAVRALFGAWWDAALAAARGEAERRAKDWLLFTRSLRHIENQTLVREHEQWDLASRDAILKVGTQRSLFDDGSLDSPTTRRRLRQHEARARERMAYITRRAQVDGPPVVEPLGVLLRVPSGQGVG